VTHHRSLSARDARLFADLQQFRKDADADLAAAYSRSAGVMSNYQLKTSPARSIHPIFRRGRDLIRRDEAVRAPQQFTPHCR
jgi:hypothetical protein